MNLQQRIQNFLSARGVTVDFEAKQPLADMEDQADGNGPYIAKWHPSLGDPPTMQDGFSDYELHRLNNDS